MEYKIISTGSKGNAVVVDGRILIDCGVPFRRLESVYRDLDAVLLTHIHSDHFQPKTLARVGWPQSARHFGSLPARGLGLTCRTRAYRCGRSPSRHLTAGTTPGTAS